MTLIRIGMQKSFLFNRKPVQVMHDKISQQYLEYLELHASDDYSSLNFIELNLLFECRLIVQLRSYYLF
ncbi:hypothetical protein T12_14578 [Trichinella patagoniensis]|uniref:Uncharacterized protein n=1 Tax=Trichinella patagoniensis TaxID=990121 RepID=A0A0V0ZGB8_9BILA|nr:hypothetical protein T12_14578 [Trichinella patagoniensis]